MTSKNQIISSTDFHTRALLMLQEAMEYVPEEAEQAVAEILDQHLQELGAYTAAMGATVEASMDERDAALQQLSEVEVHMEALARDTWSGARDDEPQLVQDVRKAISRMLEQHEAETIAMHEEARTYIDAETLQDVLGMPRQDAFDLAHAFSGIEGALMDDWSLDHHLELFERFLENFKVWAARIKAEEKAS